MSRFALSTSFVLGICGVAMGSFASSYTVEDTGFPCSPVAIQRGDSVIRRCDLTTAFGYDPVAEDVGEPIALASTLFLDTDAARQGEPDGGATLILLGSSLMGLGLLGQRQLAKGS